MPFISTAEDMEQALSQAEPRGPSAIPERDPGAVLALACHCVMVDIGMKCTLPSGDSPSNKWAPPLRWATELKDEWVFRYSMPGKRNTLVLHCSLQRTTGRMLVHTMEINNETNSHLLGLLLEKYVPDQSMLGNKSWAGALQHCDALVPMMQQHVLAPLLDSAEEVPDTQALTTAASWSGEKSGQAAAGLWGWITNPLMSNGGPGSGDGAGSYVLPAVLVTGLALAAVGVYYASKRRGR